MTRTRRARLLVVGGGDAMRDLAVLARKRVQHVVEIPTLFEAVDECRRGGAAEPVAGIIISADCEHYSAAAVADAFMRVDPSVPLVLAFGSDQEDLTAESTSEGFESSIELPAREEELRHILEDLGLSDASPGTPPAPTVPAPKNVVEEIVERAQERAQERKHEPKHEPKHEQPSERSNAVHSGRDNPSRHTSPAPGAPRSPSHPLFQMPSSPRAQDNSSDAPPSDLDLVRAVQDGHDVQGAAMRVLRHHLGSADVRFVAEPRPGEEDAVEFDRRGTTQVAVTASNGRRYGALLTRTIDTQCLQAWAVWLAHWLELDDQHQELRRLAWTDELTGAGNRRAFDKLLADTILAAQREWRTFGLMLFDIDDFKQYNDRHGHDVGDEVLKEIVELLRASVRRGDHIFRIGGDEFAVLFCDPDGPRRGGALDRDSASTIAQRFQNAVNQLCLAHIGLEGPGVISVSTGFASFPWHGLEPYALYRAADGFCLESKRAGKNRITFGPIENE